MEMAYSDPLWYGGEMEDGTIYGRATEATDPLKTCGNCHWHRKLNFDEKDLLNPVQPIPTICGVNPPTVHLIPRTVDYLAGKQTALFPENLWPFPPANEPGCSKWEAK